MTIYRGVKLPKWDVLTHHYFGLDDKVLWDTIESDLDMFESVVREMLTKMK